MFIEYNFKSPMAETQNETRKSRSWSQRATNVEIKVVSAVSPPPVLLILVTRNHEGMFETTYFHFY